MEKDLKLTLLLAKEVQELLVSIGAAARKGQKGDELIIMTFISMEIEKAKLHQPNNIFPDQNNRLTFLNFEKTPLYNHHDCACNRCIWIHWNKYRLGKHHTID